MRQAEALVERIEEAEIEADPVEDRAIVIIRRLREIDREIAGIDGQLHGLVAERKELSDELTDIACIAMPVPNGHAATERRTRNCGLCGSNEHISRNGKCPTYPNGKGE